MYLGLYIESYTVLYTRCYYFVLLVFNVLVFRCFSCIVW